MFRKYEKPVMNPITGRLEESAIKDKFANLSPEQKEYEAHHLANIFSKMSSGALRPMAIDKEWLRNLPLAFFELANHDKHSSIALHILVFELVNSNFAKQVFRTLLKEGKLTPVDQMAHQTVLDSKHSDSED